MAPTRLAEQLSLSANVQHLTETNSEGPRILSWIGAQRWAGRGPLGLSCGTGPASLDMSATTGHAQDGRTFYLEFNSICLAETAPCG
jgi:hypothetical protein